MIFEFKDTRREFVAGTSGCRTPCRNFYFHAVTAYDLLRARGLAIGKKIMGQLAVKGEAGRPRQATRGVAGVLRRWSTLHYKFILILIKYLNKIIQDKHACLPPYRLGRRTRGLCRQGPPSATHTTACSSPRAPHRQETFLRATSALRWSEPAWCVVYVDLWATWRATRQR